MKDRDDASERRRRRESLLHSPQRALGQKEDLPKPRPQRRTHLLIYDPAGWKRSLGSPGNEQLNEAHKFRRRSLKEKSDKMDLSERQG